MPVGSFIGRPFDDDDGYGTALRLASFSPPESPKMPLSVEYYGKRVAVGGLDPGVSGVKAMMRWVSRRGHRAATHAQRGHADRAPGTTAMCGGLPGAVIDLDGDVRWGQRDGAVGSTRWCGGVNAMGSGVNAMGSGVNAMGSGVEDVVRRGRIDGVVGSWRWPIGVEDVVRWGRAPGT